MSSNIIHPKFISTVLDAEKIVHRFVYILEAETKNESVESELPKSQFIIRTSKGILDPRKVPINQLLPLPKYGIPTTDGKLRIMNFIYSVKANTDSDGWQYNHHWNNNNNNDDDDDKYWSGENNANFNVRRRLWLTIEVDSHDVQQSKILIHEAIFSNVNGVIMGSDINRLIVGSLRTSWVDYYMELDDNYLIFKKDKKSNVIIDKFNIVNSKIAVLHKPQTKPEKSSAFIIYIKASKNSEEEITLQLDTNNDIELRRKWLVTLLYQVAILTHNLEFPPFPYGPMYINNIFIDGHEDIESNGRITTFQSDKQYILNNIDYLSDKDIMYGIFLKQGKNTNSFKSRFFKLTTSKLLYYDLINVKGEISLIGAKLKDLNDLMFEVTGKDISNQSNGVKIVHNFILKANNAEMKISFMNAIQTQIDYHIKKNNSRKKFQEYIDLLENNVEKQIALKLLEPNLTAIETIMQDWKNLAFANQEILLDKECIIVAASMNAQAIFDYAHESLLLDREVILAAIKSNKGGDLVFEKLFNLISDVKIIEKDNIGTGSEDSEHVHDNEESELNDTEGYEEVNQQVNNNYKKELAAAINSYCNDYEIILEAIKKNSACYKYASAELQKDERISNINKSINFSIISTTQNKDNINNDKANGCCIVM